MEKIYEGNIKDYFLELKKGILYLEDKEIGKPLFNYAKTGKLYGQINYEVDGGYYSFFIYNNNYVNVFFTEKAIKQEGDLEL